MSPHWFQHWHKTSQPILENDNGKKLWDRCANGTRQRNSSAFHPSRLGSIHLKKIHMWKTSAHGCVVPLVTELPSQCCSQCCWSMRIPVMSLFQCDECGCVEDTTLCNYWLARLRENPTLCSACDPKIAKWHDQFPREIASTKGWLKDRRGLLYNKSEVENWLGQSIEILSSPFAGCTSEN
jgi:hypothetical protein